MHNWNVTVKEAIAIQNRLVGDLILTPPAGFKPRYVAGADVSISLFSKTGYAGIVVIDTMTMETVDAAATAVDVRFPYVPGLLSFREIPAIIQVWEKLTVKPDVVIFDGVGYAHPRRFGLACHGGMVLNVPTVGCAKSILVGHHANLGEKRGCKVALKDNGEVVGMALRLRDGVKPVYVSPGHMMDIPTAVNIVQSVASKYREPETTRRAHKLVNEVRRAHKG